MNNKVLGIVLLVVGLALLAFGLSATESVTEGVVEGVTGTYTDRTTWYLIGGGALAIGGLAMLFLGNRRGGSTTGRI